MDIKYKPTWSEHEKGIRAQTAAEQSKAAEAFDDARTKEMALSTKARHWEEDRKQQWVKDKPEFVKKRIKAELDPVEEFKKELRKGGKFDNALEPMPGYLVLIVDEHQQKTATGILLPEIANDLQNTGIIVAEGGQQYDSPTIYHPLKVGSKVLFKKGAGMDLELVWGKCRLMGYGDILGVLT